MHRNQRRLAAAMSAARQALNRSLPIGRIPRIPMVFDPATLPPQRTVLESKAINATYRVLRMVQRPNHPLPRAEFHAGCEQFTRAVRLAVHRDDRCIVTMANGEILYDNHKANTME